MSYWAVARLEPRREQLAPRASDLTRTQDRDPAAALSGLLFPYRRGAMAARWSIGVIGLIMDGIGPARVADQIIDDLRKRERNVSDLGSSPATRCGFCRAHLRGASGSVPGCELTSGCWCCWRCSVDSSGWSFRRATWRRLGPSRRCARRAPFQRLPAPCRHRCWETDVRNGPR